jgi:hypothetical protein
VFARSRLRRSTSRRAARSPETGVGGVTGALERSGTGNWLTKQGAAAYAKVPASDESRNPPANETTTLPTKVRFTPVRRARNPASTHRPLVAMALTIESIKRTFGLRSQSRDWSVDIGETGRCGIVTYRDTAGRLSFYWEFGGADTVATIGVGTASEWSSRHPWAATRRVEILERIAREVIRQKAPDCRAEMDDRGGFINLC